jgi:DNA (cytosine-5)-methyltransferase 1
MTDQFKIFSMFDGVGGFIVGLDNANKKVGKKLFKTTYSNQFEPGRKAQDAYEVGQYRFPDINHSNQDIMEVPSEKFDEMKANGVNMIVGGFPCQDYSVARSKAREMGIQGKKGVLFWEIIRATRHIRPEYLVLENVDRLLKSPSTQRGRDFAIMLAAFNKLGYSVEWRVINAAKYGRAQRRRRVFFFVYRNDTDWAKQVDQQFPLTDTTDDFFEYDSNLFNDYLFEDGLFARQFPIKQVPVKKRQHSQRLSANFTQDSEEYIPDVSDNFTGKIWNTGVMRYGQYFTVDTEPVEEEPITLGDIVKQAKASFIKEFDSEEVGEKEYAEYLNKYIISDENKLAKFHYLRGSKKIERTTKDGHKWIYAEGGMSPYDPLNLPGRTMLTSEGTVNRSTHFLKDGGNYRLLTPMEAELLQDFPANWTKYKKTENGDVAEVSDRMRMFFMGNALVTGIVKRIGEELAVITQGVEVKIK